MNDLFIKIINKELPSEIIYDDNDYIAILDIEPKQPGHSLLIPKEAKITIFENSQKVKEEILIIAEQIANKLRDNLDATGIRLTFNCGQLAGQIVNHTHLHIIPFYSEEKLTSLKQLNLTAIKDLIITNKKS